jgi:L-alanine-DL-glutamate epimerase-like enolase superfamily enzyme
MRPTAIAALTVTPLDLELTEPFAIAAGAQPRAANLLVQVRLSDGTVGLGEAAPFPAVSGETQARSQAAVEDLTPRLLGEDARGWRKLSALLAEAHPKEPAARCGIEMALLDALCRHHRLPLWSFFGGAGTSLETDMTVTAGDLEHATASARAIVGRGIRILKVKVGAQGPDADAARLRAIRQVAPAARLTADANGGYSVEEALHFLDEVERAGVNLALFEQPVSEGAPEALAEVTRRSKVPICADESARSAKDVLALAQAGAADAVNLKTMKCGIAETLSMWAVARSAGLGLMIGGMVESLLSMTFSAHLAAGLGGFGDVDLDTPMFIREHPFRGGFRQTGGLLELGHLERGHGVELT